MADGSLAFVNDETSGFGVMVLNATDGAGAGAGAGSGGGGVGSTSPSAAGAKENSGEHVGLVSATVVWWGVVVVLLR